MFFPPKINYSNIIPKAVEIPYISGNTSVLLIGSLVVFVIILKKKGV